MTVALVIGSFDPVLKGQVEFIARATTLAERLIIAVEATPAHKPLYSLEERMARLRQSMDPSIEIRPYDGNLAGLAQATGATAYAIALRSGSDVDRAVAELQPTCTALGLELISFLADPTHAFVTTALVRDVARLGGDITPFVP
jgi:pantetheine-phosphate adenylyltransferase